MMSENDSYVFNNNRVFNKRKQKATMLTAVFVLYVARYSYHNNMRQSKCRLYYKER